DRQPVMQVPLIRTYSIKRTPTMTFELSLAELSAESAVELPSRSLMRRRRSTTQQMNNVVIANAVGFHATATAVNVSALNTQNAREIWSALTPKATPKAACPLCPPHEAGRDPPARSPYRVGIAGTIH